MLKIDSLDWSLSLWEYAPCEDIVSSEYRYTYHQEEIYTSDHRDIAWVLSIVAYMHQENS